MMRNIVFLIAAVIVLSSCKKSYHKNVSDFFMVTFEGTSFPCTGVKSWINEDDLDRLNLVLDIGAKYKGTAIGLVGLNGTYKKGDTIKVYVSQYKVPEDQACPALMPFPSVLVLKEELVN